MQGTVPILPHEPMRLSRRPVKLFDGEVDKVVDGRNGEKDTEKEENESFFFHTKERHGIARVMYGRQYSS